MMQASAVTATAFARGVQVELLCAALLGLRLRRHADLATPEGIAANTALVRAVLPLAAWRAERELTVPPQADAAAEAAVLSNWFARLVPVLHDFANAPLLTVGHRLALQTPQGHAHGSYLPPAALSLSGYPSSSVCSALAVVVSAICRAVDTTAAGKAGWA